jgi:hypothetical protein
MSRSEWHALWRLREPGVNDDGPTNIDAEIASLDPAEVTGPSRNDWIARWPPLPAIGPSR